MGDGEWDVKRLAASFAVAARENSFTDSDARDSGGPRIRAAAAA
jgi:hypothetical protein